MSEVLVVGAGPTGLVLATDLANKGIPFRIIDKLKEPAPHSRAFGIQPGCLFALIFREALGRSSPLMRAVRRHLAPTLLRTGPLRRFGMRAGLQLDMAREVIAFRSRAL